MSDFVNVISKKQTIKANITNTPSATTETKGLIRIATQEEAIAGVDNTTAITPFTMNLAGGQSYGAYLEMSLDTETYVLTVILKNINGDILSTQTVDFPSEYAIRSIEYDELTKSLIFTLENGTTFQTEITGLQSEITNDNKLSSDLIDDTNKSNKFVTVNQKDLLDNLTASASELNILDGVTANKDDINKLDGLTTTQSELNELHESGATKNDFIKLHNITSTANEINELHESNVLKSDLEKLHDITASASELNILDGITSSTAELNILDGVTATASEINILDGLTASTTELNYVDGVTSDIQTQLNKKLELNSISIDSNSTNYLGYDNTNGKISAKVDTTVTDNSNKLITSDGVYEAIKDDITLTDLSINSNSTDYLEYDNVNGKFSAKVDSTPTKNSTKLITSNGVYANTVSDVSLKTSTTDTISVTKGDSTTDIKISKVDEATKATKDEDSNNIKSTYATKTEVQNDITLTDLSIDSGSTNYLEYNNLNGKFGAKVDTIVGTTSTNLVTSGAVSTAITNALVGVMQYKGTWTATNQVDYSSITLPVKAGYYYRVIGSATIGSIEWNAGDLLVIENDVAIDSAITSNDVSKWDFTESTDTVKLATVQTLTNKTIDADDNTITDLTTSNFKSGVLQTSIRAVSSASDSALASEKAISSALSDKQDSNTAVTHTLSTSVGSATKGVYVNSDGSVSEMTYSVSKDVPSNAVFTDTTYSIATGSTNGTISVSVNGGTASDVSVYGLGSAAYTASSSYATSSQGTKADTALQPNDNITQLVNNAGYIIGITSSDVTTALGYTPYDSSNPNGYTSNTGTVTSVNNVSPINGNVSLTIPTVNNATLTIQKNGTTVKTFTANASSDVTCNISVPTDTGDLTNNAGFITNSAITNMQTTTNLVTSVSSASTDTQYPSAKLFYDTCGDIETLINAL